jgi:hypothetical protein
MTKPIKINVKDMPRPNKAKVKMLELIAKHPDKSKMDIGKELVGLGLLKKPENVYQMTRTDRGGDYINREIAEIRRRNFEMMSKEIVPEALKIHKKVLKDKSIQAKDKKDWVALAEKAEFSLDDNRRPAPKQVQVNIGQLQAIIRDGLSKDI